LEQGLVPRLVRVLGMDDPALRVSALWAVKNLLRKTSSETKRDVMRCLGWGRLAG
jgi:armadillo repeat-containing protein 8